MIKNGVFFLILFTFLFLINGCATIKGVAQGVAQGASKGIREDWKAAKKIDYWLRENLW